MEKDNIKNQFIARLKENNVEFGTNSEYGYIDDTFDIVFDCVYEIIKQNAVPEDGILMMLDHYKKKCFYEHKGRRILINKNFLPEYTIYKRLASQINKKSLTT